MAVPSNYVDKITKGNDSRMISPAADMVRVNNDNFDGETLDEVLDDVAQAIGEAGEGGYAPPAGGIPKTDLAQSVQDTLDDVANKVNKETGKSLMTDAERTKLQNLPTATELTTQLGQKANDNTVVKSVSVNGTPQTKDSNGNVDLTVAAGQDGDDGKSAYQSYLDTTSDNPKKTEAQWVASLKGADGATGATGATGPQGPAGPQGNSGVASADGIESVNNLNGGTVDTEEKVYVLGANMGKLISDTLDSRTLKEGDDVDMGTAEKRSNYYIQDNNTVTSYSGCAYYSLPIVQGKYYKVYADSTNKTRITIHAGNSRATGFENYIDIAAGGSFMFLAPSDADILRWHTFVAGATGVSAPASAPSRIAIYDRLNEQIDSLIGEISDVSNDVKALNNSLTIDGEPVDMSTASVRNYYYINDNNSWTSYTGANDKKIPIVAGSQYKVTADSTNKSRIAITKESGFATGFDRYIDIAAGESFVFTAPSDAVYLRAFIIPSGAANVSSPSSYPSQLIKREFIVNHMDSISEKVDDCVEQVALMSAAKDMLDIKVVEKTKLAADVMQDGVVGSILSSGSLNSADSAWRSTDYIPVCGGTEISWASTQAYGYLAIYDKEKQFVASVANSTSSQTYTPSSDGYFRYCVSGSTGQVSWHERTSETLDSIKSMIQPIEINAKWLSLGTSITWYNNHLANGITKGYQTRVREVLKFRQFVNNAVNGGTMGGSNGLGANVNSLVVAADYVTIEHGINDWGNGVGVGTIDDFINDTGVSTFCGAYRKVIDAVYEANSSAQIIICTPRKGYGFNSFLPSHWYDAKSGIYLKDYADAAIEIARFMSLPICDWFNESGMNQDNLAANSIDVALHPNDEGFQKMANLLVQTFKKILPYE